MPKCRLRDRRLVWSKQQIHILRRNIACRRLKYQKIVCALSISFDELRLSFSRLIADAPGWLIAYVGDEIGSKMEALLQEHDSSRYILFVCCEELKYFSLTFCIWLEKW